MALPNSNVLPDLSISWDVRDLRLEPQPYESATYDQIVWTLDSRRGAVAACLRCDDVNNTAANFVLSEEKRGGCKLYKEKDQASKKITLNQMFNCNFSGAGKKSAKLKQSAGLVGANAAKLATNSGQASGKKCPTRVGKDARGTGATCCACRYSMHCRVFRNHPNDLYIVLHNHGKHSSDPNEKGCAHQPLKVSDATRAFCAARITDGVPNPLILQSAIYITWCG